MLTRAKTISFKNCSDKPYFKITSVILNKKDSFTLEEISKDIKDLFGYKEMDHVIQKSLNKQMNNGLIIKHGSFYSVL